jgi:hypothetical protein
MEQDRYLSTSRREHSGRRSRSPSRIREEVRYRSRDNHERQDNESNLGRRGSSPFFFRGGPRYGPVSGNTYAWQPVNSPSRGQMPTQVDRVRPGYHAYETTRQDQQIPTLSSPNMPPAPTGVSQVSKGAGQMDAKSITLRKVPLAGEKTET